MVDDDVEMVIYIAEGLLVVVANVPVALVIFFSAKFKNAREFTFIGGLCLADSIYGCAYAVVGALGTRIYASGEQNECSWLPWLFLSLVGYQSIALMTLLISVDRLVAVYFPTWHLNVMTLRKKTSILIVIFSLILSTTPLAWLIQSSTAEGVQMLSSECYVSEGLIANLWSYVLCFRAVVIAASCLVYIPIGRKLREMALKNVSGHKSQLSKNRKLVHLTVTTAITTAISLFLLVIPDIVFFVNAANVAAKHHVLLNLFSLANCVINVVVYNLRHRELRRALVVVVFNCLGRTETKVSCGKRVLFNTATDFQPNACRVNSGLALRLDR